MAPLANDLQTELILVHILSANLKEKEKELRDIT